MLRAVFTLLSYLFITTSFAQLTLQQKLQSDLDLKSQFETVLSQSRNQDADFKIIRKSNIQIIQKNVQDSVAKYKDELAKITSQSANSISTISALRDSVQTLQDNLSVEKSKTESIGFLGIDFNKGAYHTLVWSIIAVLAIGFIVTLISFRKAKVDTVEHKKTAEEVQHDFQAFKKKAMETEQKLKRQLLDEQLKRNG